MAGEGGGIGIPIVSAVRGLVRTIRGIGKPTPQQVAVRVAGMTQAEQARVAETWRVPWWTVAGWSASAYQRGVQQGFLPAPETAPYRTPAQRIPTPERGPYISPALYVSSAVRQAARARAAGGARPPVVYSQQPGNPQGTGSGTGSSTGSYSPLTDPNVYLTLLDYILSWIRKPVRPVYNYIFGGFDPMAYFLPSVPTPTYGGGGAWYDNLPAIGGAIGSLISTIRGGAPSVMPGGAPFGGLALGNYNVGVQSPLTIRSARQPQMFGCDDGTGRMVIVRRAGMPLAWSGDVSAVKRLKRAHRIIAKAVGGHRGRR